MTLYGGLVLGLEFSLLQSIGQFEKVPLIARNQHKKAGPLIRLSSDHFIQLRRCHCAL